MRRAGPNSARAPRTQQFARFVTRNRFPIAVLLIAMSLFFLVPIVNTIAIAFGHPLPGPALRIDTRARDLFPDHPYIRAQDEFASVFGGSSIVVIAVTVEDGTIFTPETLGAIDEITRELDGSGFDGHVEARDEMRRGLEADAAYSAAEIRSALDRAYPRYPVNHDQVSSLTHHSTRVFRVLPDGAIEQDMLVQRLPETQAEADSLRDAVRRDSPFTFGRLVANDEAGALVSAGFVTNRLNSREAYTAVFDHVQGIKRSWEERMPGLRIHVSGDPILRGWIIRYTTQILLSVTATVLVVFVLLWLYFRRWHGVVIPMIAAAATAIWGLGFTGWMGIPFDPLILVIPMIITGRAVSHTVQMAERFFEDYEVMLPRYGDPEVARVEAAASAMGELIVPGTLGIITDVAGLLVIMVTSISQMQNLAIFGSFWVLSIIASVEILHPVLICYLPPPKRHDHYVPGFMIRLTRFIGDVTTHRRWKYVIGGGTLATLLGCTYLTLSRSTIGISEPGTPLLRADHEFNIATREIAAEFGGIDSLVIYADGDRSNSATDAKPIKTMERLERALARDTELGSSTSVVPFLRELWRVNHYGDPKWYFVPDDTSAVRAMIFQLQQNGPPGFLRPYMSDDGRKANITFFYPDHRGDRVARVTSLAESFIAQNPLGEIDIRLREDHASPDAAIFDAERLKQFAYYMLGPLLPDRHHTLEIRVRREDGAYVDVPPTLRHEATLPDWLDEFREGAQQAYWREREALDDPKSFPWPEALSDWSNDDVGQWWDSEDYGIRAVEVGKSHLIVEDTKAVGTLPRYQPTNSWTRGVRFVMAGGSMGVIAAINEEVERCHVANISLIFLVIFTLHAITYRSLPSGMIILLQIATATMVSLAYMAVRGIGLNINTLPVQSVGVGIGVDYAIYIVDRIRQEVRRAGDVDEGIRRAIRTTGLAVCFTATTVAAAIFLWVFSDLRFQAEMAYLLVILMALNMLGAIIVVPAFYSIVRPKVATSLLEGNTNASVGAACGDASRKP